MENKSYQRVEIQVKMPHKCLCCRAENGQMTKANAVEHCKHWTAAAAAAAAKAASKQLANKLMMPRLQQQ